MMAAVGGSVLSTTLQVVFDRIALNKNFLLDLFLGNKKLQLKRLERVLQIVSQVLQDAENKQDKSPAVKSWFNSLKHAVYQVDDVLDEINTDNLRIQMTGRKKSGKEKEKQKVIPLEKRKRARACHFIGELSKGRLSDFSDQFIGELSPRLVDICEALERKVQKIGVLGLEILHGKQKREDKMPSTSVVKQSQIYGRDDEKEEIIQMVLSSEGGTDISVIPIIGMGGIGKTALAQLVYNDERMNNHFETRAWVCVSDEFDVYRTTKELLMEVNSSVVEEKDDLNCLQVKLKINLEGKRFIIILDDIWNDNYADCQRLMIPLNSGNSKSKIIITTRNENIALMLQNKPFHRLKPISDDQSWSLFKLHAFDNRVRNLSQEFETIGKTMVGKCKGLPLAIKTVAGALRSKEDIREWHDILNNDNWMAEGDILPALSLSYKLLPSHLKCCFAFCALFPKDAPIDKEDVARLWMANDLVQPSSQKVAENYFEELRARSFFEMGNDNKYVMHDLVNDLARHVSGYFCARMEDCQLKDVHQGIQVEYDLPPDFSYQTLCESLYDDTWNRSRGLAQVQGLRTFLTSRQHDYTYSKIFFTDILPKLRHIRALYLPHISEIPDSIGYLKHLRLLNLVENYDIQKLPNSITKCLNLHTLILAGCESLEELPEDTGLLINLQTLILAGCRSLKELPEDIGLLINLQHLDVTEVGFKIDEIRLSKLKDIQNLSIVVDEIHGNALEQLDKLQLGQLLRISELGNAVTVEMARTAQLKNKDCIEELILEWRLWRNIPECSDDWDILVELRPHTNIRKLTISAYGRTTFPNWVGDSSFCNLEELNLYDCPEVECFPDGGLPPSLETLHIARCKNLMKYPRNWGLQRLPSLVLLRIEGIEDKLFPEKGLLPATLKSLTIKQCPNLQALNHKGFQDITSLQELYIISYACQKMVFRPPSPNSV